jgi:hypothetical protein
MPASRERRLKGHRMLMINATDLTEIMLHTSISQSIYHSMSTKSNHFSLIQLNMDAGVTDYRQYRLFIRQLFLLDVVWIFRFIEILIK